MHNDTRSCWRMFSTRRVLCEAELPRGGRPGERVGEGMLGRATLCFFLKSVVSIHTSITPPLRIT